MSSSVTQLARPWRSYSPGLAVGLGRFRSRPRRRCGQSVRPTLIVLDASAAVELLLGRAAAERLVGQIVGGEDLAAPHLIDAEVGQVVRRYERAGAIDERAAWEVLDDLGSLPLTRYPHGPLLHRACELRHNVTMYDGVYLALAELLDASLVTADAALSGIPGCRAQVRLLSSSGAEAAPPPS